LSPNARRGTKDSLHYLHQLDSPTLTGTPLPRIQ
jgi:hypothetical protein